ncbi:hypothetical protein SprV_0301076200 [Sparganum proliferum]
MFRSNRPRQPPSNPTHQPPRDSSYCLHDHARFNLYVDHIGAHQYCFESLRRTAADHYCLHYLCLSYSNGVDNKHLYHHPQRPKRSLRPDPSTHAFTVTIPISSDVHLVTILTHQ